VQKVDRMTRYCQRGARLWSESCPGREVHGICVKPGAPLRPGALPAPENLRERRLDPSREALQAYRAAWRMWDEGKATSEILASHPQRLSLVLRIRECAAQARFRLVEPAFVRYLNLRPPSDLGFDPAQPGRAEASLRALRAFLKDRLARAAVLVKRYQGVITGVRVIPKPDGKLRASPRWSLAAMARTAQVFHDLAHTLDALPPPKFLKNPGALRAYRSLIERFTKPLLHKARQRYQTCVDLAREVKRAGDEPGDEPWATLCRKALERMAQPAPPNK
jgi:hypothetical protein